MMEMCEDDAKSVKNTPEKTCRIANPVSGMSREEAYRIAKELGDGKEMGTWKTMSGEEFLAWWRSSNNIDVEENGL